MPRFLKKSDSDSDSDSIHAMISETRAHFFALRPFSMVCGPNLSAILGRGGILIMSWTYLEWKESNSQTTGNKLGGSNNNRTKHRCN